MNGLGENGDSRRDTSTEIILPATPVSRGVSVGVVTSIYGENRQYFRSHIREKQVDREVARFRSAHATALRRLASVGSNLDAVNSASIFDMHRAILEDSTLGEKIESAIRSRSVNAEWAVKLVTDEYIARYRSIPEEHFRDRYIDVEDVAEQLQTALAGGRKMAKVGKNAVIAAKELRPSTLAELGADKVNAIITENGGWTSHSFIIARELGIPAVTGVRKLMRRVHTGDTVLVDGFEGKLVLNPSAATLDSYRSAAASRSKPKPVPAVARGPIKTIDGREIVLRANFDLPASFHQATAYGAKGIGLYRSEYLFNRSRGFPREAEQIKVYRELAAFAGEDRVRVRTFDLSINQTVSRPSRREPNPALGMRGIRLSLASPKHLRTQLRALLQAAVSGAVDVIIPMVSGVDELRATRKVLEEERSALIAKGIPVGEPRLGAMIELPSAVLTIDSILEESDCLCLGTNDLVQYTLGVDRDNEFVSGWFRSLHPAIVSSIENVLRASERAGKSAVLCGEMAGSIFYVPLLIGLGATELSMNVNSILAVRKVISGIAYEETRELVANVKLKRTADEIEKVVRDTINTRWRHLYPTDFVAEHPGRPS